MIKVLLVDDQTLIRTGFRLILEAASDMQVVGEAADGKQAVELSAALAPDVVLMDIRMPVMDGIVATGHIRALGHAAPRVIILTTFDLEEYVDAALRAGASGFLLKDALAADVLTGIRTITDDTAVLAPSVTRRLIDRFLAAPAARAGGGETALQALTAREREVFMHVATGQSNAEIAERLFLSEGTVKAHVSRILHKLQLRDRVQAVILGYDTGLTKPQDGRNSG